MIEGALFIGAVIAGITQFVKLLSPKINGSITIALAVVVGVLVAIVDKEIGVVDITVAQGIMIALGTTGVVGAVQQIGNNSNGTTVGSDEGL